MRPSTRRKIARGAMVLGTLVLVWAGVTYEWGDPFTGLYTRYEQHELAKRLNAVGRAWQRGEHTTRHVAALDAFAGEAAAFAATLHDGDPIGRIAIPRLGLHMVVVQGTSTGDLAKGPGHYDAQSGHGTTLPGMGGVVAIAGHRTTFLAPFRHLDELEPGDRVELSLPYGTFDYRVFGERTVLPDDWSILRPRPFEELVLSACTPLYSASHRLVAFARLVSARAAA